MRYQGKSVWLLLGRVFSKVTGQLCEEHSYRLLTHLHPSAWNIAAVGGHLELLSLPCDQENHRDSDPGCGSNHQPWRKLWNLLLPDGLKEIIKTSFLLSGIQLLAPASVRMSSDYE